jgi:hypothetical protein
MTRLVSKSSLEEKEDSVLYRTKPRKPMTKSLRAVSNIKDLPTELQQQRPLR